MRVSQWHLVQLAAKTLPPPVTGQGLMLSGQRLFPQKRLGTLAFSACMVSHSRVLNVWLNSGGLCMWTRDIGNKLSSVWVEDNYCRPIVVNLQLSFVQHASIVVISEAKYIIPVYYIYCRTIKVVFFLIHFTIWDPNYPFGIYKVHL